MSTKTQKIVAAITATALAASVMLGGTLAWQSINQEATNIVSGTINPGGRLHDDFDGNNRNKDIYVENFADQEIYARIQLREYLEIGTTEPGTSTDSLVIPSGANHDATATGAVDTWAIHYFDETQNATDQYVDFSWGGTTTYLPTFNMNKDSLLPDINGTYEGTYPDGTEPTGTIEDDRYSDYVDYATVTGGVTGYEVWDADLDNDDEVGEDVDTLITLTDSAGTTHATFQAAAESFLTTPGDYTTSFTEVIKDQPNAATHIPTTTRDATVISMADWKAMTDADKDTFYGWVYDTDGWAYWSQPIEPKTVDTNGNVTSQNTTGLLLDAINPRIDDNYYYQIHVIAQFITANDLGQTDGTGFFAGDKGSNPSADALALLNTIGVNIAGGSTLTVTSSAASVAPGGSVTLTATNPTTNSAVTGATWIINGSNVASTFSTTPATATAIDPTTGILTVAATEQASKLTVIAIYENETTDPDTNVKTKSTLIGSYDITVSATAAPPASDEYVVEISEATNATKIYAGGTLNFSAKVSKGGVEENSPTIVWDVLDETDTTGTTITDGELTVGAEPVNTVLKVTATYTDAASETYTDTYEVTVVADAYTVAINETPTAQLANGTATQTFTAAVTKNGTPVSSPAVTWSVDSNDANTTITGGVLTIAKTEPKDKLVVTATYEGETDTVEVPVTHTYVVTVTAADSATTVAAGEKLQFSAAVTRNGENYTPSSGITWSYDAGGTNSTFDTTTAELTAGDTAGTVKVTATATAEGASGYEEVEVTVVTLTQTQKDIAGTAQGQKVTIEGTEYWVVVQDTTEQRALLWKVTPVGQTTGTNGTKIRFDDTPAWKDSEMQNYLNTTYLNSLPTDLKNSIKPTTIKTANDYMRSGNYVETTDSVFLLTEADVFGKYLGDDTWVNSPGADEYTYVKDNTPAAIVTEDMKGWTLGTGTTIQYAWLRSPRDGIKIVAVVASNGIVNSYDNGYTGYIRPAFWVNLES